MTASRQPPSVGDHRQVFDSSDAAAVSEFLDAAYGNSLRIADDPRRLTFRRLELGAVSVDDMTLGGQISFRTDRVSRFTVMECHSGTGRYDRAELSDDLAPGEVVAAAAPGQSYAGYCGPLHLRLLNLDLAALTQAAIEAQGGDSPLQFHALRALRPDDRLRWARLVDFVELTAERGRAGGLAERELARVVARTALEVFPNSSWDEPSPATQSRDRRDATDAAVRRATRFIDSAADQDLELAAIATAAHLSPRALQAAFRRHLDTTPMRYLQGVRLEQARRALDDADAATTIAAVASRWGFYNHGRFAAHYREAFGELPSHTLARVVGRIDGPDVVEGPDVDHSLDDVSHR